MNLDAIDNIVTTPELDVVRIASIGNGSVLLVKEIDDPNWKLPGGKIEAGETVLQAVEREMKEELGVTIARSDILNYHMAPIPHCEHIRHIFLVKTVDQTSIKATDEVAEARYFPITDLPETKFKEHISTAIGFIS